MHITLRLWDTRPNSLSGKEKSEVLISVSKNQSLRSLDLTEVSLVNAPDALTTLCTLAASHPTLTSLHLDPDTLNIDQIKDLFINIIKHKKITDFKIGNSFFIKDGKIITQSLIEAPLLISLKAALLAGLNAEGLAHAEKGEYVEAVTWQDKAKLMDPTYAWKWSHSLLQTPFKASVDRYYDNTSFGLFSETRDVRNELMTVSSDGSKAVEAQLCDSLEKIFKLKFLTKESIANRNDFSEMTVPSDPESSEEKLIDNLLAGWLTISKKTFKAYRRVIDCVIDCYAQHWKGRYWLVLDQKGVNRIFELLTAAMEMLTTPKERSAFLKQLEKIQTCISLNQRPGVGIIPRLNQALGYCPDLYDHIDALKARVQLLLQEADMPIPLSTDSQKLLPQAGSFKASEDAVKSEEALPHPQMLVAALSLSSEPDNASQASNVKSQAFPIGNPAPRPRTHSREKAEKKSHAKEEHRNRIEIKSDRMIDLSRYRLGTMQKQQLKEFRNYLQSAISDLLLSVKVISARDINPTVSPLASLADAIASFSGGFIPYVGPMLHMAFGANLLSRLSTENKKTKYAEFSKFFPTTEAITAFSVEFSGLITAYYYAEILDPSCNRTYMQRIYDFVTSGGVLEKFKQCAHYMLEKYITGEEDKLSELKDAYKAHWPDLISCIMGSLLVNVDQLTFADVDMCRVATKLSAPFTQISSSELQFNAKANELDLINAYTCIRLSFLAYETERKISELAELWGYDKKQGEKRYQFIFEDDFQAFMLADREKICVVFRGTATAVNALTDMHIWLSQVMENSEIKIHTGFMEFLGKHWNKIKSFISCYSAEQGSQPSLWFIGHSLGGALATLAAFWYLNEGKSSADHIHLYTYGQPKCGNQAFADYMDKNIKDYQRFVNYLDPFIEVPFECMDYAHGGQLRWIDKKGNLHDQVSYKAYKGEKDCHGKEKVRDNVANLIRHLPDHSVYLEKIGKVALKEGVEVYTFAEYIDHDFEMSGPQNVCANSSNSLGQVHSAFAAEQKEHEKLERKVEELERRKINKAVADLQTKLQKANNENSNLKAQLSKQDQTIEEISQENEILKGQGAELLCRVASESSDPITRAMAEDFRQSLFRFRKSGSAPEKISSNQEHGGVGAVTQVSSMQDERDRQPVQPIGMQPIMQTPVVPVVFHAVTPQDPPAQNAAQYNAERNDIKSNEELAKTQQLGK